VRAFRSVGGEPVFFREAQGATLTSVEGVKYIDFCQSFGPLLLGHRDPDVSQVVRETIESAWTFGACEPYSLDLAEWLTRELPFVEKVRFVSSGTEAVMSALRVARAATKRSKILKFDGCYHGHVDSLLVKAGSGLATGEAASDSAGVPAHVAHDTVVAPLDDCEGFARVFNQHRNDLAAVIIEPLPANYGLLPQRATFLGNVFHMAKAAGVLVIFDEVISGFRVGLQGMAGILGLSPDLVTYGKVMGGGFPVGAYGGRRDLMDLVAPAGPVYQAGTLSANPVGMRAGLATLQKSKSLQVWAELDRRTESFVGRINHAAQERAWPFRVARFGSVFWFHAKTENDITIRRLSQIPARHVELFKPLFHAILKRGVYLAPSGFEVGFIGLAHTEAILNQASAAILDAGQEIHG
jgi:glutamate-1-semialdehyde 2,1-aminomutase